MLRKAAVLFGILFVMMSVDIVFAQTLGTQPMLDHAVQGQNGAQPEGAFFNFINWIGNVVAPVGAGGAVFGAIIAYVSGRGASRWLVAVALLAVSGITR